MSDYAKVQAAVTEYTRAYIASRRAAKMTFADIAKELDCTDTWVKQLMNPAKYGQRNVGGEVEYNLARILHHGSVDGLRRAALHRAQGGDVIAETADGSFESVPAPPSSAPKGRGRKVAARHASK